MFILFIVDKYSQIWASRDYELCYCIFCSFHVVLISLYLHLGKIRKSDTNLKSLGIALQPQGHKISDILLCSWVFFS